MFDGRDFDEAERMVDDWRAGIELRAEQAREFVARMEQLSVTARSDDKLVTVTIGAGGDLTGLELDERVRERSADETARQILATLRAAQGRLTAAVEQVTAEVIGIDSATGQAIVASYRHRLGEPDA